MKEKKYALHLKFNIFEILLTIKTLGCLKLTYRKDNDNLKVAYSSYKKTQNNRAECYRYGYNGKEKTDEVSGGGVSYDYGFRIYDARIARFSSVDPLAKSYPFNSTYAFAMNRPIDGVDLDGLEFLSTKESYIEFNKTYGGVALNVGNFSDNEKQVWSKISSDPANWGTNEIGASPRLASVVINKPSEISSGLGSKSNDNDAESKFTASQDNVNPDIRNTEKATNGGKARQKVGGLPGYQNPGGSGVAMVGKGVSILTSVIDFYAYYKNTYNTMLWSNIVSTSYEQQKLAERTVKIMGDALNTGLIDPTKVSKGDIFDIMNYVLQGNANGNKQAEEYGKLIINTYEGIPNRTPDPPVNNPPASVGTYGPSPAPAKESTEKK